MAVAWQLYALSSAPTALAVVGLAQPLALFAFSLVGGALVRQARANSRTADDDAGAVLLTLPVVLTLTPV